jgi:hypothetical protein
MTLRKGLACALALAVIGTTTAQAQSSAQISRQFSSAVSRVLHSVRDRTEFLRELSNSEFNTFVSCAQRVMNDAPMARKRYVLAAGSLSAQRQRFDEVALDNRAALKQRITRECA